MKKDIFFNSLVLILGVLFFAFQFSVEYQMYEGLKELLGKAGDIQPSMSGGYIGKRTLFGIILVIISYFTIRKSIAFKTVGKVGIFFLFLGILVPFFFIIFVLICL